MSTIAIANLFLKSAFTALDSARLSKLLDTIDCEVSRTRKGRFWNLDFLDEEVSLKVTVSPIDTALFDVEDDMLGLQILPGDDWFELISIFSARGRDEDLDRCDQLCRLLSVSFACITSGARLAS